MNKKIIKEMGKQAFKGISEFSRGYICGSFTIPKLLREQYDYCYDLSATYGIGAAFGIFSDCGASILFLTSDRNQSIFEYSGYVLLSAAATNIASGLYEWYRYNKNELVATPAASPAVSSSSAEPEKKSGLEKITEANPAESNFTDPWKVKVPIIEERGQKK